MDREALESVCGRLPVFPLSGVVLMPGSLLPLHVYESRYRALVEHCMRGERCLGVATLVPGSTAGGRGRPPIYPELGVGRIVSFQRLRDGRLNVAVRSVGRAQLDDELTTSHPFRMVRCHPVPDVLVDQEPALTRLRAFLLQLGSIADDLHGETRRLVALDGVTLVDYLAYRLIEDPGERRRYLGTHRVVERIGMVRRRLDALVGVGQLPIAEA